VGIRAATGVRLSVSADARRLSVTRRPEIAGTLAAGETSTATILLRGRRPGRALVRVSVVTAEAEASPRNNASVTATRVVLRLR
jgi:hypothetical protein